MGGEILINQLFAGTYLGEANNIGHEIINLFKADDGVNYLYITSTGVVLERHDVESVVFVRNLKGRKTVEAIAAATGLSRVAVEESENIEYAGVPLRQIFGGNVYHGDQEVSSTLVTFRADEVFVPKDGTRVIITIDEGCGWEDAIHLDTDKKVLIPQGMRSYFSLKEGREAYLRLDECIHDESLWAPVEAADRLVLDGSAKGQGPSFLEMIRKENDELVFSNLLAYYFDYNHAAFQRFSKECLGIPEMDSDFEIARESRNHIDLWIESGNHVIVIENKIKSGINGVEQDGTSQLSKYHEYTLKMIEEGAHAKQPHFYIFAPDYSSFDLSLYNLEDVYSIIRYSAIYEFFRKNVELYLSDRYFPDFLLGLQRHTMSMAELNLSIMRSRFLEKIRQAQ